MCARPRFLLPLGCRMPAGNLVRLHDETENTGFCTSAPAHILIDSIVRMHGCAVLSNYFSEAH